MTKLQGENAIELFHLHLYHFNPLHCHCRSAPISSSFRPRNRSLTPPPTMSTNSGDPAQLRLKQISAHIREPQITDYPLPHYASTAPTTPRLKDKVAIITGCDSDKGIGRAAATIFAASGAKAVVICDLAASNLATWAKEIGGRYPETSVEWRQFDASGTFHWIAFNSR